MRKLHKCGKKVFNLQGLDVDAVATMPTNTVKIPEVGKRDTSKCFWATKKLQATGSAR